MSAVIDSHPPRPAPASRRHPLATGDPARTVAVVDGRPVALGTFLAQVRGLAARLPAVPCAVNLCEDRYRFLVAFCAVALRGQTTLLPPARTRVAIDEVRAQHPDSYCIGDLDPCGCQAESLSPLPHFVRMLDPLPELDGPVPEIDDAQLVAIGFTSGSTGAPKPNRKHWAAFRVGTARNLEALADLWPPDATPGLVATVPAQHMYGIEMSVLFPLLAGAAVHAARPFFPGDVAAALRAIDAPRLLVTTPVHLRALLESEVAVPPLAGIVSATAPLSQALAAAAETRFGCEVRETFGSTETCIIARRRTALETVWTPLAGVRLHPQPDGTLVERDCMPAAVTLADLVELQPGGGFLLCGRQADLLEIAGKRASLADLTRRLLAIPGVEDGAMLQLDQADAGGVRRIAALAVAPGLDEAAIHAALRRSLDPVFLPRRLRLVPALPRNETGKLPRAALLALLRGDSS
ncbi:acyl-CoA synthetase [Luteimonas sp. SJ-92]|uniref:Acyl-CoA synthetase n=1 Tax=Luteimonas salinisoli TaxID=2752307 RepID=A0A853JG55_9GAMM|nr:AMP-binding protein [Luteimonas salinisoli]NZA27438.1 acyl-CoA synthetase [Luteimonas salinisoli]